MPAGSTYTPIATTTLGSAVATVTFSSISGSYTDLVIVFNGSITTGFDAIGLRFNGDTASNYSRTFLAGNGSTASSGRDSNATSIQIGIMGTERSNSIFQIMNYSNSTTFKTAIARGNAASNATRAGVGLWRNTAAITEVSLTAGSSTFISGSTFTLYGIASA
jgi:hypothetical protein